jgi:MscS family membrane protein
MMFYKFFFYLTKIYYIFLLFFPYSILKGESPLAPLKIDTPRRSISIFIESMNIHRKGTIENDQTKIDAIYKAIKCLNLKEIPPLIREDQGKEIAIFLKETIDKVYVFQPNFEDVPNDISVPTWTIPETEITLSLEELNGKKEYLFTTSTILNARIYFNKTKSLPYLKESGQGAGYSPPFSERFAPRWTNTFLFGLLVWQWLGLFLALFLGIGIKFSSTYLFELSVKLAKKSSLIWDDQIFIALSKPGGNLVTIGFWYIFLYLAGIDGKIYIILSYILKFFMGIFFIKFLNDFSDIIGTFYKQHIISSEDPSDVQLVSLLIKLTKILLVSLGVMLSLQNMGINVISLLAGLGIGGLAIALAARDTAANLFGSLMILLDKPFKTGDYIKIGTIEGVVEEIGFRSTQIKGDGDSSISMPNSLIANSNIENLGIGRKNKSSFSIYLPYDTNPINLEFFLDKIKSMLTKNPMILRERILVNFYKISDPGLEIYISFFMASSEIEQELNILQKIYLDIFKIAGDLEIKFVTQNNSYSLGIHSNN